MKTVKGKLTIDNVEYNTDNLSDQAKQQLINRLNAQLASTDGVCQCVKGFIAGQWKGWFSVKPLRPYPSAPAQSVAVVKSLS